jgi:hypothetical protein
MHKISSLKENGISNSSFQTGLIVYTGKIKEGKKKRGEAAKER